VRRLGKREEEHNDSLSSPGWGPVKRRMDLIQVLRVRSPQYR
jgi:hypothetical protein